MIICIELHQLFCDDFSTNLTISWMNDVIILFSILAPPQTPHHVGPYDNVSWVSLWLSLSLANCLSNICTKNYFNVIIVLQVTINF